MCRMREPRVSPHSCHPFVDATLRLHPQEGAEQAVPSHFGEMFGKASNDPQLNCSYTPACEPLSMHWVEGAIIIGAGPAGLATAACLRKLGVPSLVLERENCIGSLWRYRTYDRLRLHIAKQFCELPYMPFPLSFPTFPTRAQFLEYLDDYARAFDIQPQFNESVQEATYCAGAGLWKVESKGPQGERTFLARWLVAATGENAQPVWPDVQGLSSFNGKLCHSSDYKSGEEFSGKRVLVVGGGNSGLELALDLANHEADVYMSVRSQVHILPREIFGFSTFAVAMTLLKFFSLQWTDRLLLLMSRMILGETSELGFPRPKVGPMEMKCKTGKTPSLDAGTLSKIREGCIEVLPEVLNFDANGCSFMESLSHMDFDAIILATGFKSNVPSWLKENELFSSEGFPKAGSPRGKNGLYSAGFARKGLLGVSMDAQSVAEDISKLYYRAARML
ncbi:hypothetical protein GOP47_0013601 [Adiantum capillus-veneris]|uniref:Flavin-containing monooxygenase n=1 Tax=Adiantum capillus-veneris TaxID=13818 RepID=A0A9D4ZFH2_ADICA|nr:hypothetical protein GOP47_0013601 [Adiantum capillus-veneris]